ncbi:phosphoribosylaminoimidazolesuccinocarboxamide synthase [Alphaproteobacteria bacterium]|jgi:phosphoribosylaminoimidazole-succinocarboxamide synthase|nr:phosphoribosylaminoimidazolesuccinocarboxamide synthase [Alphaproteobacteria bacterium]MDA9816772.1 phosphoribosylaminoimidazolesuccinocarboxamide synthase [Alphaproteobacteria bacterium]MDB2387936.1 phosphoribosylaminoimidazolesuccinocarboxamide synthase [Alphaproteobacteria bacterium]MDB2478732.1 phosphoribosylaminoimidazolesuccinocarboxamide synthase [Alphaproteobacteria bacterium]
MTKKKMLYEGKAKTIFEGPTANTVIQYFKDDATANNAEKHSIINGKGVLNNSISDFLMRKIHEIGIPTHYIKKLNMREQLVKKVEIIPVEFVVRNIAAGSIVKRLGLKEGEVFPNPLIEYYLKRDDLGDPLINEDHIVNFNWGTREELEEMQEYGLRINDFLRGLFLGIGLKLVDFKIEFGRYFSEEDGTELLLADEISPDNCRLWDIKTNNKFDKDLFRQDIGGLKEAYQEVAERLKILPEKKLYSNTKTEIVQ